MLYVRAILVGNCTKRVILCESKVRILGGQPQNLATIYPMDGLGLQRGKVELVDYNQKWRESFDNERLALFTVLGESALVVEHIGSTAIPGIKAKPILDIMVAIPSLNSWEECKKPLETLSYQFMRDMRTDQQHVLFVKGPEENRTHYLKLAEYDSDFWNEHLVFRDFLISHPEQARAYEELKISLLEKHQGDRKPYTAGKAEFIEKTLRLAGYTGEIV